MPGKPQIHVDLIHIENAAGEMIRVTVPQAEKLLADKDLGYKPCSVPVDAPRERQEPVRNTRVVTGDTAMIKGGEVITCTEKQVPILEKAGWRLATDAPPAKEEAPASRKRPKAGDEPAKKTKATAAKRPAKVEEDLPNLEG